MHAVLIGLFIAVCFSQTPVKPTLSNDFGASVTYTETSNNRVFTVQGFWYSDYTDGADAFDVTLQAVGDVLVFENKTTHGVTTWIYRKTAGDCSRNDAVTFLPHPFSFIANSQYNGTCQSASGTAGAAWGFYEPRTANITLCTSVDGKTPFYLEEVRFGIFHSVREIQWANFVPGKPSGRYFVLPDACKALAKKI